MVDVRSAQQLSHGLSFGGRPATAPLLPQNAIFIQLCAFDIVPVRSVLAYADASGQFSCSDGYAKMKEADGTTSKRMHLTKRDCALRHEV